MRRQAEQPADQIGDLRIALGAEPHIAGRHDAACQHRLHGAADFLDAARLHLSCIDLKGGQEPGSPSWSAGIPAASA
jgi:hypothetical protein